jgi:hypothetical protein
MRTGGGAAVLASPGALRREIAKVAIRMPLEKPIHPDNQGAGSANPINPSQTQNIGPKLAKLLPGVKNDAEI